MAKVSSEEIYIFTTRLIFSAFVASPFWWANTVLPLSTSRNISLLLAVFTTTLPERIWKNLPLFSSVSWRIITFMLLAFIPLLVPLSTTRQHPIMAGFYAITGMALLGACLTYRQPRATAKLAMAILGCLLALLVSNLSAGIILKILEKPPTQSRPTATPVVETPYPTELPPPTKAQLTPAATLQSKSDPLPTPTPEPDRPIAGFGYMDFIQDGGEAEWTHLTGYGPRINSRIHAYMYDTEGNTIYDTIVDFNSKGMRGPEVTYGKPDNVYRILIIGDSFVEAIQVDYDDTFYALLQRELDKHGTAERRYEVLAIGRTGWGTLHEYIYYHVEGYKLNAELVILMFYINDVADNYPIFFSPDINNTNYEFIFADDTVRIVDTNQQSLPPNSARRLYNALPAPLQKTSLARLFVRLGDPPIPVMTPGGVMTRVHPQYYIYVTKPVMEGYPEAWKRTEQGLRLLATEIDKNGGQFAVVPIFLGSEMVQNISGWFPALVEGWQWDIDLPEKSLALILNDLPAQLVSTRPTYEAYAEGVGGEVYNLLYLPGDGHFNKLGHQLTKEVIYNWLVMQGIVE